MLMINYRKIFKIYNKNLMKKIKLLIVFHYKRKNWNKSYQKKAINPKKK